MSKYKNNFAKGYVPNWSQKFFLINEVKNTVLWKYVISDLNGKEFVRTFYEKELQKTNQREFRLKTISCILNGKATTILLTIGLIK